MRSLGRGLTGILLVLISWQCGTGNGEPVPAEPTEKGTVVFTSRQMENMAIQTGPPEPRRFEQKVEATGYLVPEVGASAEVNSLIPGRIRKILVSEGQSVSKGEELIHLEGGEIVTLQQQYASLRQDLMVRQASYERLKSLQQGNVASQREFQQAEGDYLTTRIELEALKVRLKLLSIDPEEVSQGKIASFVPVRAPIPGVITRLHADLGQYVHPGDILLKVIDPGKTRLKLTVFEKDREGLIPGQKVIFTLPGAGSEKDSATLQSIGSSIDPATRSITCYAVIGNDSRGTYAVNSYVEASIITCEREVLALPEESILQEGDLSFVWQQMSVDSAGARFRKIPVRTGPAVDGYTEILDSGLTDLVISGASRF